jgi:predicted dehydrogenase
MRTINIAVIGLGGRLGTLLKKTLDYLGDNGRLAAITELKPREQIIAEHPFLADNVKNAALYSDAAQMLEKEQLDGVMIGTNCSSHARYAKMVFGKNLPLFLEKPVAINFEQWQMLRDCYEAHDYKTVISFPLMVSPMVELVKKIVDSGELGTIEHVQAYNYVPYGDVYYRTWYRDVEETGGLFLQKATHDFDYINYIVGRDPVEICAMSSHNIFKGNKPAGLECDNCEEKGTCPESHLYRKKLAGYTHTEPGRKCCFAVDSLNQDSATAIVRYDGGIHMSYTQNFFARKHAAKRGARFSGYYGTVEFDWYANELKVYPHKTGRVDTYRYDNAMEDHFGGDDMLVKNFADMVKYGKASMAPMRRGLVSALMCLNAIESEKNRRFMEINF